MESKHRAAPSGIAQDPRTSAFVPFGVARTSTSGPSLPALQRSTPQRPAMQEAARATGLSSKRLLPPPRVLVGGSAPLVTTVLPRMEESTLSAVLADIFDRPCPDLRLDTLHALAFERATALDATGRDDFIEHIIIPCSGCLLGSRLASVVAGLVYALPGDAARNRCRDRLLSCLTSTSRSYPPGAIARLTGAVAFAFGASGLARADFEAFVRLVVVGVRDLPLAHLCEILKGLCVGLGGPAMDRSFLQELVLSLCDAVCDLEDPRQARQLMRQVAHSLGDESMAQSMRHFLVDLVVDEPSLDPLQMGDMLLGLADCLDAAPMPGGTETKTATGHPSGRAGPSSLAYLLAASLELGRSQLVHVGLGLAVALRTEADGGVGALGQALAETGIYFDPSQLTALGCGMAAGLCDGLLGESTRVALLQSARLTDPEQHRAFDVGLRLPHDPLGATEAREDDLELLELAWQLPSVLNARTAPAWFEQIRHGKAAPGDRVHVLALLMEHGARHLPAESLQQARDLSLAYAPQVVFPIYGAWINSGLPEALFDLGPPLPPDLTDYRLTIERRLAQVEDELAALPGLPCEPVVRQRLVTVLVGARTCLSRGLQAAREQAKAAVSEPATR